MIMDNRRKIKISSLNTGGINNIIKQNSIFQWLKQNHTGIIFIQESHSCKGCETRWEREFVMVVLTQEGFVQLFPMILTTG